MLTKDRSSAHGCAWSSRSEPGGGGRGRATLFSPALDGDKGCVGVETFSFSSPPPHDMGVRLTSSPSVYLARKQQPRTSQFTSRAAVERHYFGRSIELVNLEHSDIRQICVGQRDGKYDAVNKIAIRKARRMRVLSLICVPGLRATSVVHTGFCFSKRPMPKPCLDHPTRIYADDLGAPPSTKRIANVALDQVQSLDTFIEVLQATAFGLLLLAYYFWPIVVGEFAGVQWR